MIHSVAHQYIQTIGLWNIHPFLSDKVTGIFYCTLTDLAMFSVTPKSRSGLSYQYFAFVLLTQCFIYAGPLCPDKMLPGNHYHWLQCVPLLRPAVVQDIELVSTQTHTVFTWQDKEWDIKSKCPCWLLSYCIVSCFYFVTDVLRFVINPF